jgi:cytochrome c556|tara:strand:+ start:531 stop:989 length:459 start_codon:yes stop_codon:yes gene_type:complete
MKRTLLMLASILLLAPATLHADRNVDFIKYRKAVYSSMKGHMGAVSRILRGRLNEYTGHIIDHAEALQRMAHLLPGLFPAGTGFGETAVKTAAKPEVWKHPEDFRKAAKRLEDASADLAETVRSGNVKAIRGKVGAIGKACKGCHQQFRRRD